MLKMVDECKRILKNNGIFLVTFLSKNNSHFGEGVLVEENTFAKQQRIDDAHIHHFSDKEEVMAILNGFDIVELIESEEEVGGKLFKERWHWYVKCKKR